MQSIECNQSNRIRSWNCDAPSLTPHTARRNQERTRGRGKCCAERAASGGVFGPALVRTPRTHCPLSATAPSLFPPTIGGVFGVSVRSISLPITNPPPGEIPSTLLKDSSRSGTRLPPTSCNCGNQSADRCTAPMHDNAWRSQTGRFDDHFAVHWRFQNG